MKVTYIDHCGSDLSVVNAARVSFDKKHDAFDPEKDAKLIRFLAKHNHISPFNHTFITLHVKAPVFVARQLVKHKFMPWNEMSGRYVTFEPEFYTPDEYRAKAADKKQGSGGPIADATNLALLFAESHHDCFERYKAALAYGLCEEQARGLLPLDLMTQWYWSGTLGAWASMYNLRAKPDAQAETQEVARQAGEIIAPLYPHAWEALTA
jgi:thymidylate synthase (FAD)